MTIRAATIATGLLLTALPAAPAVSAMPDAAPQVAFADGALPTAGRIAVPVGKDGALSPAAMAADAATGGAIARAMAAADFKGGMGDTLSLYGLAPYDAVLLVGTGKGLSSGADVQEYGGAVAKGAAGWEGDVAVALPEAANVTDAAGLAALGTRMGAYKPFNLPKLADRDAPARDATNLIFHGPGSAAYDARWQSVAGAVNWARDLMWTPSNVKTPAWFADQVETAFRDIPRTRVTVLDVADMKRMGMGGILAVGMGSERPPRMIAVSYDSPDYDGPPVAFVGKGITFDTGGISLKQNNNMWLMRQDMTGAAVSIAAVKALAESGAKVDVVAIGAMAENMPSGSAGRPGDVVTTMSGKTFEVLSTDAEGRMVLTDGLWWAQDKFSPRLLVSVATLTGSVGTALGDDFAGMFTNDDGLAAQFLSAGAESGDDLWRLPVHESVRKAMKSDVADLKHSASGQPGASVGAAFLMEWVKEGQDFVHLDIAGRDWSEGSDRTTEPKGATGFGVRLLDEVARRYAAE